MSCNCSTSAALNRRDEPLPVGGDLAKLIWNWTGYEAKSGEYDGTPLDRLFDAARSERGDRALLEFLSDTLLVRSYPDWYRVICYPFWRRIYTTNVDDLVERCFSDTRAARLETINAIRDRVRERDQFLERVQYVKLNGSLPDGLDCVTFGSRQFARRASEYDVWYDQFVRDYSTHVTIIIGSKLNEPLFLKAIEERQGRHGAALELRLRSFLVADRISPATLRSLADFKIVPVEAAASEFMTYLGELIGEVPEREEMLLRVDPQRAQYFSMASRSPDAVEALKAFFGAFTKIDTIDPPKGYRSLFYHGATPDWNDLAAGLDAPRDITSTTQDLLSRSLEGESEVTSFVVADHRGAGKSTLLMRVAVNLSAAGYPVYFAVGEDVPDVHFLARAVDLLDRRVALVIDDAEWVIGRGAALIAALRVLRHPPTVVLALRTNSLYTLSNLDATILQLGELSEHDIDSVIDVLKREDSLGVMTGLPRDRIREAFRTRAKKQLLVAMKEVTTGRQFDEIIRKEYHDIEDPELRLTYLIACLATAAGASLTRTQLLSSSELPPALLLSGLARELRGMLIHAAEYGDRVVARHSVIALTVIEKAAAKPALATAYKRIVSVLANDMGDRSVAASRRWFRLYKSLINHAEIYRRFERDVEEARSIFDALTTKLNTDAHYWLQYGSLELEVGELDLASRYIATAESLHPHDFLVRNAKGHLLLALARTAMTHREAVALRAEGEALLEELIAERGDESDYPWHILLLHVLQWVEVWVPDAVERRAELAALRERVVEACEARPQSRALQDLRGRIEKSYLMLAVES